MLFWLGFIGVLGPLALDIYLPALPAMAQDLKTTAATVQFGLATTTTGMALGTFVVGPLTDRLGRRVPLLTTGLLMASGAILAALSPNVAWFLACCFLMGASAAAVQVAGRGVIADLTRGNASTRAFSLLSSIGMIGPIVGPAGGVLLLSLVGWRGIFVALAVFAITGTIAIWFFVPESLAVENRRADSFSTTIRSMLGMWNNRVFTWFAIVNFASYAMLFVYLGTCSLTIQLELRQPPWVAAVAFAINGAGIVVGSVTAARLARFISSVAIVYISVSGLAVGILFLGFTLASATLGIVSILVTYLVICVSLGISLGAVISLALTHVRKTSGTALGLLGLIQFIIAAFASVLVGTINPSPAMALLIVGGIVVAIAIIGTIGGQRALKRDPDLEPAH